MLRRGMKRQQKSCGRHSAKGDEPIQITFAAKLSTLHREMSRGRAAARAPVGQNREANIAGARIRIRSFEMLNLLCTAGRLHHLRPTRLRPAKTAHQGQTHANCSQRATHHSLPPRQRSQNLESVDLLSIDMQNAQSASSKLGAATVCGANPNFNAHPTVEALLA